MLNPFCPSKEWSETFYPPFANWNAISEQLFANKALHCFYTQFSLTIVVVLL